MNDQLELINNAMKSGKLDAEANLTLNSLLRELETLREAQAVNVVIYPFPLRENRLVYLHLPVDLTADEVERLKTYLSVLVVEEQGGPRDARAV